MVRVTCFLKFVQREKHFINYKQPNYYLVFWGPRNSLFMWYCSF